MPITTVTSKGQVTIPKKVRDQLRLRTGDRLDFRVDEDGSIRVYPIAKKAAEVFGAFHDKAPRRYRESEVKSRLREAFRDGRL